MAINFDLLKEQNKIQEVIRQLGKFDLEARQGRYLRAKGLPVAYVPFEGEQHGFRRAENIKRALDAELFFYASVLGFELAEPVEPVEIQNL